jgi:hypothetical protein
MNDQCHGVLGFDGVGFDPIWLKTLYRYSSRYELIKTIPRTDSLTETTSQDGGLHYPPGTSQSISSGGY